MKKTILVAIMGMGLMSLNARATVSIAGQAFGIQDNLGNDAPTNTVGLFIVDKSSDGIANGPLIAGSSITVGSTFGGADNVIVGVSDIASTEGTAGTIDFGAAGLALSGGIATGEKLAFVWLPNQSISVTTLQAGFYGYTQGPSSFGDPWLVPSDGATVSIDFFTVAQGGSHPNTDGLASHVITPVPEPSSLMLVGVGLLGMVRLIRRRS